MKVFKNFAPKSPIRAWFLMCAVNDELALSHNIQYIASRCTMVSSLRLLGRKRWVSVTRVGRIFATYYSLQRLKRSKNSSFIAY